MVVVLWSVSCALQESSVSQNSKNSAITAHSTGEEEATKRFDFLKKRLLAAETSVILLAFQKRLTCCHQVLVSEDTLKVKPLQFCASLCHQNGEAVWQQHCCSKWWHLPPSCWKWVSTQMGARLLGRTERGTLRQKTSGSWVPKKGSEGAMQSRWSS